MIFHLTCSCQGFLTWQLAFWPYMIFCLIQAYDVVGGLNSYVKIISFILEVDAGLAMLANHYVIWYLGIYKDQKKKTK